MSTSARFPVRTKPNEDNTARVLDQEYQAPIYAASIALKLSAHQTVVNFAQLTGALTVTAETTRPLVGDRLTLLFATDGTQRIVTLGTGFGASGTITIPANKYAAAVATFNGAVWMVTGREIQA